MPIRKVSFVEGEFYHLYNRGNSKQIIFKDENDYRRFQILLYLANSKKRWEIRTLDLQDVFNFDRSEELVAIGAYCLMPNHFHLLLTPLVDRGVELFMQKLSTGYSMYFNTRHHRSGSLFEGRFKAQHADTDEYLKYLYAYILLNPVKLIQSDWREAGQYDITQTKTYLYTYAYSSYVDMSNTRSENAILNHEPFPAYFNTKQELDTELLDWLTFNTQL